MIIWIWCKVWGHKYIAKAYTDDDGYFFKYEQQKYCPRCGIPNPYFLLSEKMSGSVKNPKI